MCVNPCRPFLHRAYTADKLTVSLQRVDNYEYQLPSDFEDEEIDEEAALTEADKKQFAEWFGDNAAAGTFNCRFGDSLYIQGEVSKSQLLIVVLPSDDAAPPENASEHDLLNSESEQSAEEELNPDDYSEDVSSPLSVYNFLLVHAMPDHCLMILHLCQCTL